VCLLVKSSTSGGIGHEPLAAERPSSHGQSIMPGLVLSALRAGKVVATRTPALHRAAFAEPRRRG